MSKIESIAVHRVGNKSIDEPLFLSQGLLKVNDEIRSVLYSYFISPFKSKEYYSLYHETDLALNEVYAFVSEIFKTPNSLYGQSIKLAKHLYEQNNHPNIKGGEFYVVYFKELEVNGIIVDAIGLFKSENKDTFLKVYTTASDIGIESEQGININKLDKGCLIFNIDNENGYLVSIVDNINKGTEAHFWVDDFLRVQQRKDEYYNTQHTISLYKSFITKEFPRQFEVDQADQADLINKSVKYFKEKDTFDIEEFENEVIVQPEVIDSFNAYKVEYLKERDLELSDSFSISESAVKKQARGLKSVIKLDKNFHIYVHGDRQCIKRGFDEATGMHYYQLFFNEET